MELSANQPVAVAVIQRVECLFNKQNALNYPVILRLRTVPANKSTLISRLKCSKKSNYLRQYGKDVKQ